MYVNVIFDILSDKKIANADRELCINLMSICVNIGITLSAAYELFMDNTYFSDLVNKSHTDSSGGNGCSTISF